MWEFNLLMVALGAFHWNIEINQEIKAWSVFFIEIIISRCFPTIFHPSLSSLIFRESWEGKTQTPSHKGCLVLHENSGYHLGPCVPHTLQSYTPVRNNFVFSGINQNPVTQFSWKAKTIGWPILWHPNKALTLSGEDNILSSSGFFTHNFYHDLSCLASSHILAKHCLPPLHKSQLGSPQLKEMNIWCWWGIVSDSWGSCGLSWCREMAPELPKKIFGAVLCNQPLHHCPTKAEMANLQLRVWDEVRDKAHSSGKLGVLSFKSTQERPCLCFPLSHFLLSHRSRAGLFQSWQFKEERSHSMNSPWICCRDFVSFTHLQGARSSTEVLALDSPRSDKGCVCNYNLSRWGWTPSSTFLWNVKFLKPSGWSPNCPKCVEQGILTRYGSTSPIFIWNQAEAWLQACPPEELLPCKSGTQQRNIPQPCPKLK